LFSRYYVNTLMLLKKIKTVSDHLIAKPWRYYRLSFDPYMELFMSLFMQGGFLILNEHFW